MRNPILQILEKIKPKTASKPGVPEGMALGVPGSWYVYGFPPRTDWLRIEQVYRTFPMVSYSIEQFSEQIVGPGYYLLDRGSPEAVEICKAFDESINAKAVMLRIARELGLYGNSCLERRFTSVEKDPNDEFKAAKLGDFVSVQPLPISTMRVVPSMFTGADPPKGYTQIIMGQWRRFAPEQIAWFKFNVTGGQVGSDFYGQGMVQPILDYVWAIQQMEDYMVRIMKRYAAPKILWKIGTEQSPPSPEALAAWAATLKTIKPDEDWVAPFTNSASTVETNLQARFEEYVSHMQAQIIAGLQNPNLVLSLLVLRVSDASARAMLDAWNRKIQAIQDTIKELWEDLIYKPLVVQAGIDESLTPEISWGQPDVISTSPKAQIDQLTLLLNPTLVAVTPQTRFDLENQLREAFGFDQLPQAMRPAQEAAVAQTAGQPATPAPLPASTWEKPPKPGKAGKKSAPAQNGNGENGNGNQKAIAEKIRELERNDRK
jgi:hypothetical protein